MGWLSWIRIALLASVCVVGAGRDGAAQESAANADLDRRLREATRRIESDPRNADLLVERAELFQAGGRWDEMRADLDRAIGLQPRSAIALGLRGLAAGVAGEHDRALADIDAALGIDPTTSFLWSLRGYVLLTTARYGEAIEALDRAISLEPSARAHFDRAACHREQGDLERAIEDYTAALRHDPELVEAVSERAHVFQRRGEFARALEDLDRCRAANPRDPQAALSTAWILATCPDRRIRDGNKASRIAAELCDPSSCEVTVLLTALAAARAESGDHAEAESLQRRAATAARFHPTLREDAERRLATIVAREPLREAAMPLELPPRGERPEPPGVVTPEEAAAASDEVLALDTLNTRTLLAFCPIAKAGATVHAAIDGEPLVITAESAGRVGDLLEKRDGVIAEAIRRRGFPVLAAGYVAETEGDCRAWELERGEVLVEQDGFEVFVTQGGSRHMGIVVGKAIAFRHDANTAIRVGGVVKEGRLAFTTASRGGLDGSARRRCLWTLAPATVEGPAWSDALMGRANARHRYGHFRECLADLDSAMRLRPHPDIAALQAFILATCADESVRDGKRACEKAEIARSLAGDAPSSFVLMALAAAHAEAGDFAAAVRYQREVLEVVPEDGREEQRERLRMFEAGKPYRAPLDQ